MTIRPSIRPLRLRRSPHSRSSSVVRDQERVEGQVERVGDQREEIRALEQALVVVDEDAAGDEQRLSGGQQVPRRPLGPGGCPRSCGALRGSALRRLRRRSG